VIRRVHDTYRPMRAPRAVYRLWDRRLRLHWWVRLTGWLLAAASAGLLLGRPWAAPLGIVILELVLIVSVAIFRRKPSS
jgi:hypothetical protein